MRMCLLVFVLSTLVTPSLAFSLPATSSFLRSPLSTALLPPLSVQRIEKNPRHGFKKIKKATGICSLSANSEQDDDNNDKKQELEAYEEKIRKLLKEQVPAHARANTVSGAV